MNDEGAYRHGNTIKDSRKMDFFFEVVAFPLLTQHCLSGWALHKLFQSWSRQTTPTTGLIDASEVGKTQSNNLQVARKATPLPHISVTPLSLQQKLLDCEADLQRNVRFANGFAGSVAGYNCGYCVAFVYSKQREKIFVFKHFIWQRFALYVGCCWCIAVQP